MNSTYSPALAPWSTDGRVLRDAQGNSIASGGNNRMVIGAELAASMKLAAAAPELLAALDVCERVLRIKGYANAADTAKAAIAKARGEA